MANCNLKSTVVARVARHINMGRTFSEYRFATDENIYDEVGKIFIYCRSHLIIDKENVKIEKKVELVPHSCPAQKTLTPVEKQIIGQKRAAVWPVPQESF